MQVNQALLPTRCYRNRLLVPKGIVIHFFSAINVDKANAFDPAACRQLFIDVNTPVDSRQVYPLKDWPGKDRSYASAHIMICREEHLGVWQLVPEKYQAYHAGASSYAGMKNWNGCSLGIELLGTAESGFEDYQYQACAEQCSEWMLKYDIPIGLVVGHEQVSPGRKVDPGIATGNFDMDYLKELIKQLIQENDHG